MKIRNINYKLGFSLLELLLAVAIFALGSFALITILIDSNINTRLSTERTDALFHAKEGINAIRSIRDRVAWAELIDGDYGLAYVDGDWTLSTSSDLIDSNSEVNDNKYERTVTLTEVSSSTKNVSVNINWDLTPARNVNVVLNTIITNWKNN